MIRKAKMGTIPLGNGSYRIAVILLCVITALSGFCIGTFTGSEAYAAASLPTSQGESYTTNVTADMTFNVASTGTYFINVEGEGYYFKTSWGSTAANGGKVSGKVELNKGDEVKVTLLPGGAGAISETNGGAGVAVYINNQLVMGAGGPSGPGLYGKGSGATVGASASAPGTGGLSGGGAGSRDFKNSKNPGGDAPGGAKGSSSYNIAAEAGGNYINTALVSEGFSGTAASAPTSSSDITRNPPTFVCTNVGMSENTIKKIILETVGASLAAIQSSATAPNTVYMTVAQNQSFNFTAPVTSYDGVSRTSGGITVSPATLTDLGQTAVQISGTVTSSADSIFVKTMGPLKLIVKVIPPPTSSTVTVTFEEGQ